MPVSSTTRYLRLGTLFPATDVGLDADVAQLCVLYEDLRIELTGASEETIASLDGLGHDYPRLYFLRRSIATLLELVDALAMLDRQPAFAAIRSRFDADAGREWGAAIQYTNDSRQYRDTLRNDFGGHFGHAAARYAVRSINDSAVASIEVYRTPGENRAGARLRFAGELAATAMGRHKGARSSQDHFEGMVATALDGYRVCAGSVQLLARYRFLPA
jgi:hypothetical protein